MPRVKGSKNKPKDQEVVVENQEVVEPTESKPKPKVLIGYHPISGAEVWQ